MSKTTISEFKFLEQFSTETKAVAFFEQCRWKNGRYCPSCGSIKTYPHTTRKFYYHCKEKTCRKQFSCKTNTMMQSSRLPVKMWIYAMYKVNVGRKGISSLQLSKELGITQKSAWFMLQRIKEACGNDSKMLSGIVEVDETCIGGLEKNKHENKKRHSGRGGTGKANVLGMRERGGKTKAIPIERRDGETLQRKIRDNVVSGNIVYTDEFTGYIGLKKEFKHDTVNHSAQEFVNGMAHTNGVESAWAVLKRSITGTYHHVSEQHLQRYLNEATFRLNEGNVRNMLMDRIINLCGKMSEKTLSYVALTRS